MPKIKKRNHAAIYWTTDWRQAADRSLMPMSTQAAEERGGGGVAGN